MFTHRMIPFFDQGDDLPERAPAFTFQGMPYDPPAGHEALYHTL